MIPRRMPTIALVTHPRDHRKLPDGSPTRLIRKAGKQHLLVGRSSVIHKRTQKQASGGRWVVDRNARTWDEDPKLRHLTYRSAIRAVQHESKSRPTELDYSSPSGQCRYVIEPPQGENSGLEFLFSVGDRWGDGSLSVFRYGSTYKLESQFCPGDDSVAYCRWLFRSRRMAIRGLQHAQTNRHVRTIRAGSILTERRAGIRVTGHAAFEEDRQY